MYVNQESRWNWGAGISHIPYRFATYNKVPTSYNLNNTIYPDAIEERYDIVRIFQDQLSAFTSYPLSKVHRVEFGTGVTQYYYKVSRQSYYYDKNDNYLGYDKQNVSINDYNSDPYNNGIQLQSATIFQASTALVGDNSFFGVASPLSGFRYRLEAQYNFGSYRFFSPTIDLRKYTRVAPVTFAMRLYGYGRFGKANALYPMFLGYPFLMRGYESQTFYNNNGKPSNGFTIDQLSGSRIAVGSFEVRLPFTGPEKLSQIKSKLIFSELNLFFDAGLAWNAGNQIKLALAPDRIGTTDKGVPVYNGNQRVPALSTGISLRVNLFGYFVLEPYFALPLNRTDVKKPVFGLGFTPGW